MGYGSIAETKRKLAFYFFYKLNIFLVFKVFFLIVFAQKFLNTSHAIV